MARSANTSRQSREDWLIAALGLLRSDGIGAVQITELSRRLGVTRGSFYWHFDDRGELLEALLEYWHERNTGVMVGALENAESLTDGILRLFSVWVDHDQFDPTLDQAIRDWARQSEAVRKALTAEDDSRIEVIAGFFRRFGYAYPEAFIRARVIYFTQVSYYALEIDEPMDQRMNYLAAYFQTFTGREIDEADAKDYRARMIAAWDERP